MLERAPGLPISVSTRPTSRRLSFPALLATLLVGAGCATPVAWRNPPNYPVRFSDVETITLVPPLVSVYSMSSGDIEQEVQEWSDAANEHAQVAVRELLTEMGKTYVPYAGRVGPRPDFRIGVANVNQDPEVSPGEQSWLLFESAKESILRHTYEGFLGAGQKPAMNGR